MPDKFIHPDVRRKFDSVIPDNGTDGFVVAYDGEDIAKLIYPFVAEKSDELKKTYNNPPENVAVIDAIVATVCANRELMLQVAKQEAVQEKIVTARDLVVTAITSVSMSKMLKEENIIIESENDSDIPPTRNIRIQKLED